MAEKKRDLGEIFASAQEKGAEKGPEKTRAEIVWEGSVGEFLYQQAGKIWDGAIPMAEHGAAELMSAAYTGNAYVPYGWTEAEPGKKQENEDHGLAEEIKEVEKDRGLER